MPFAFIAIKSGSQGCNFLLLLATSCMSEAEREGKNKLWMEIKDIFTKMSAIKFFIAQQWFSFRVVWELLAGAVAAGEKENFEMFYEFYDFLFISLSFNFYNNLPFFHFKYFCFIFFFHRQVDIFYCHRLKFFLLLPKMRHGFQFNFLQKEKRKVFMLLLLVFSFFILLSFVFKRISFICCSI